MSPGNPPAYRQRSTPGCASPAARPAPSSRHRRKHTPTAHSPTSPEFPRPPASARRRSKRHGPCRDRTAPGPHRHPPDHPTIDHAEHRRRMPGHLTDRLLQTEQLQIPRVMAKHAGKRAPQPRMRITIVRQAVAADHRQAVRHDPLHVRPRPSGSRSPGRDQSFGRLISSGPTPRRYPQHPPGEFRMRIDQVICTGTSLRSRSGISTVDPAAYG